MVNYDKEDSVPYQMSSTDILQCKALEYEFNVFKMKPTFDIGDNYIREYFEKRIEEYQNGKKV